VRGREAREISITVHQTNVSVSLDRPPKGQGKGVNQGTGGADKLSFIILSGYDRNRETGLLAGRRGGSP
jgi:hypothetical protein